MELLENKEMATIDLKAMQGELHETQIKSNALAEQMREVDNGMVRIPSPSL